MRVRAVETTPLSFPSKKDGWLVSILSFAIAGELVAAIFLAAAAPPSWWIRVAVPVSLTLGAVFIAWTLFGTYYELDGRDLVIRSGPIRWRVPLENIESVTPSRAINSSPALSLDRLDIRHSGSAYGVLVSPDDREAFLRALLEACPQLRRTGDGLERG